jgi:hypothetical protein
LDTSKLDLFDWLFRHFGPLSVWLLKAGYHQASLPKWDHL